MSGPFGPDEAPGALLLFRADDKAQVYALVAGDPFTPSQVIAETVIAEWEPVIGPLLPDITGSQQANGSSPVPDTESPSGATAAPTSAGSDRA